MLGMGQSHSINLLKSAAVRDPLRGSLRETFFFAINIYTVFVSEFLSYMVRDTNILEIIITHFIFDAYGFFE